MPPDTDAVQSPADASVPMRRLVVVGLAAVVVLLGLCWARVPIGQPDFLVYRYSPVWSLRLGSALGSAAIAAAGLAAVWRWGGASAGPARVGWCVAAATAYAALVVWTLFAQPYGTQYHLFTLFSPSHDGAFFVESRHAGELLPSVRDYVGETFYDRLARSPEDMAGRRVLSNPPGMTVAATYSQRLVYHWAGLREWLIDTFHLYELQDPEQRPFCAAMLVMAAGMTLAWGLAVWPAYGMARLWLSPVPAATIAFACVFNPASVDFTPGKDPAQLLTVLLIMYGWLRAYERGSWLAGALAGVSLAAGLTVGLIHVWIAGIVGLATLLHAGRDRAAWRRWWRAGALPLAGGAGLAIVVLYVTLGWNLPRTVWAVGARYGEIQLPIITDPWYWTAVGLPMFLLFVGPACWVLASGLPARRAAAGDSARRLGGWLLAVTAAVLAYTYFFANNSETPRLWLAFIPALTLGLVLRRGLLRGDDRRDRLVCIVLLALHVGGTLVHWSVMDVRETEYRLATQRMWD